MPASHHCIRDSLVREDLAKRDVAACRLGRGCLQLLIPILGFCIAAHVEAGKLVELQLQRRILATGADPSLGMLHLEVIL